MTNFIEKYNGLFSSNKDEWATPQYLFDSLDQEFNFTLAPFPSMIVIFRGVSNDN